MFKRSNTIRGAALKGETQPELENIGTILWLLGRRDDAIATFKYGADSVLDGSLKFGDNAGGVSHGLLLWYAGVTAPDNSARDHALRYLAKLAKRPGIKWWPGSLALFALHQKAPEEVLAEACGTPEVEEAIKVASSDLLKRRSLAKTLFYMAVRERAGGREEECRTLMVQCAVLENPIIEVEWYLARAEVEKTPAKNA